MVNNPLFAPVSTSCLPDSPLTKFIEEESESTLHKYKRMEFKLLRDSGDLSTIPYCYTKMQDSNSKKLVNITQSQLYTFELNINLISVQTLNTSFKKVFSNLLEDLERTVVDRVFHQMQNGYEVLPKRVVIRDPQGLRYSNAGKSILIGPGETVEKRVKNSLGDYVPVKMVIEQGEGEYATTSPKKGGEEPYIIQKRKQLRESAEKQSQPESKIEEIEEVGDIKKYLPDSPNSTEDSKTQGDKLKIKILLVGCLVAIIVFRIILKFMQKETKGNQAVKISIN